MLVACQHNPRNTGSCEVVLTADSWFCVGAEVAFDKRHYAKRKNRGTRSVARNFKRDKELARDARA
jgi:hypothetical protein